MGGYSKFYKHNVPNEVAKDFVKKLPFDNKPKGKKKTVKTPVVQSVVTESFDYCAGDEVYKLAEIHIKENPNSYRKEVVNFIRYCNSQGVTIDATSTSKVQRFLIHVASSMPTVSDFGSNVIMKNGEITTDANVYKRRSEKMIRALYERVAERKAVILPFLEVAPKIKTTFNSSTKNGKKSIIKSMGEQLIANGLPSELANKITTEIHYILRVQSDFSILDSAVVDKLIMNDDELPEYDESYDLSQLNLVNFHPLFKSVLFDNLPYLDVLFESGMFSRKFMKSLENVDTISLNRINEIVGRYVRCIPLMLHVKVLSRYTDVFNTCALYCASNLNNILSTSQIDEI